MQFIEVIYIKITFGCNCNFVIMVTSIPAKVGDVNYMGF